MLLAAFWYWHCKRVQSNIIIDINISKKFDTSNDVGFDSGKPKDTFCMNWLFYCTTNLRYWCWSWWYWGNDMLNSGDEVLLLMQKHDQWYCRWILILKYSLGYFRYWNFKSGKTVIVSILILHVKDSHWVEFKLSLSHRPEYNKIGSLYK